MFESRLSNLARRCLKREGGGAGDIAQWKSTPALLSLIPSTGRKEGRERERKEEREKKGHLPQNVNI